MKKGATDGDENKKTLKSVAELYKTKLLSLAIPERIFVLFSVVFGLLFIFITPPMQSPDEVEHLFRGYQVSEFNIIADQVKGGYGGEIPASLVSAAQSFKGSVAGDRGAEFNRALLINPGMEPLNSVKKEEVRFDNTAIYSPIPYVPQAIGIGIGRIIEAPPVVIIYLGRIANLIAFITLIYAAIRLIPAGKWAILVIALNPLAIFLVSSLSSDTLSIGLAAVLVAMIVRINTLKERLSNYHIALLVSIVIALCLTKNTYIPFVFLLLLIPRAVLKSYIKILLIGISIVVGVIWNLKILSIAKGIPSYFGMSSGINSSNQISYILHQPFDFISTFLINVLGPQSSVVLPSYVGIFGWVDTPAPYWVGLIFFVLLILALFYRPETRKRIWRITVKVRLLLLAVFVASFSAIFLTLYLGYNEVGSKLIGGIQGRYFIPLTFLLVPILFTQLIDIRMSKRVFLTILITGEALIFLSVVATLVIRYYF